MRNSILILVMIMALTRPVLSKPLFVGLLMPDRRPGLELEALQKWSAGQSEKIDLHPFNACQLISGEVDLRAFDVVWIHHDGLDIPSSWTDEKSVRVLREYLEAGGGVLMTLNGSCLWKSLGLEPHTIPNMSPMLRSYLNGFRVRDTSDPLWADLASRNKDTDRFTLGMDGVKKYSMICQAIELREIEQGKVLATPLLEGVGHLYEYDESAVAVSWNVGKGKALWIGHGILFNVPANHFFDNLEKLIFNALTVAAGQSDPTARAGLPAAGTLNVPTLAVPAFLVTDRAMVWTQPVLQRVPQDVQFAPADGKSPSPIRIDAARGEYESFQLVVSALNVGQCPVKVAVQPFQGGAGVKSIPPANISWSRLGYVEPFGYADVMLGSEDFTIAKRDAYGSNVPLIFTIKVPDNASPGEYHGAITITLGEKSVSIPISLRVRRFVLPKATHLRTGLFNVQYVPRYMPAPFTPEYDAYAKETMQFLADHRISHDNPFPYSWRFFTSGQNEIGKPNVDVTTPEWLARFDSWADFWHRQGLHINNVTPYGLDPNSGEYQRFFSTYAAHLKEKGWLDEAYTRIAHDEFDGWPDKNGVVKEVLANGRAIRAAAPGLKISATVYKAHKLDYHEAVASAIDIWMLPKEVMTAKPANLAFYQSEREKGKQLWFYVHNALDIASEPPALRRFFMDARLSGATGCLLFNMTQWHNNGASFREGRFSLQSLDDTSGCLFWPGEKSLVPSVRLVHFRDGMEDQEYLWMLQEAVKAYCKSHAKIKDPVVIRAQETIEKIERLVSNEKASLEDFAELRSSMVNSLDALFVTR